MQTLQKPVKEMILWANDSDYTDRLVKSLEENGWEIEKRATASNSPFAQIGQHKRMLFGFRQLSTLTIRI